MALTDTQKRLFDGLIRQWDRDQLAAGNTSPLVTLAFATNAQVKAATIAGINAEIARVQAEVDAAAAAHAAEDQRLAAQLNDLNAIKTELNGG